MTSFNIFASLALFLLYAGLTSAIDHENIHAQTKAGFKYDLKRRTVQDTVSVRQRGPFERLRRQIIRNGNCPVQVCFALDGSNNLRAAEFRLVKGLTRRIAGLVGISGRTNFSAVQYGIRPIVLETSTRRLRKFNRNIAGASYTAAGRSFLASGFSYCVRAVKRAPRLARRSSVIVIGNGQTAVSSRFLNPVVASARPSTIYAVGVGSSMNRANLLKVASVRSRLYTIGRDARDSSISDTVIGISRQLCNLD